MPIIDRPLHKNHLIYSVICHKWSLWETNPTLTKYQTHLQWIRPSSGGGFVETPPQDVLFWRDLARRPESTKKIEKHGYQMGRKRHPLATCCFTARLRHEGRHEAIHPSTQTIQVGNSHAGEIIIKNLQELSSWVGSKWKMIRPGEPIPAKSSLSLMKGGKGVIAYGTGIPNGCLRNPMLRTTCPFREITMTFHHVQHLLLGQRLKTEATGTSIPSSPPVEDCLLLLHRLTPGLSHYP